MLVQVHDRLYVGDLEECPWAIRPAGARQFGVVVHAAKDPCHKTVVDYGGKKSLPPSHPEYLWAIRSHNQAPGVAMHLALNVIDPPVPLFKAESFLKALDFIDEWIRGGGVLVHCNQGLSRAPAIACLWLAKRAKALPGDSWREAVGAFLERMPAFAPGLGIDTFLAGNWGAIR